FTGGRIYNNTVGLNVSSSNLTTGAGIHLYGNSYDMFVVDAATLDLSGMVFDNPAGDFTGYSNLSIVDTQTAGVTYSISWTTNSSALPADTASFAEKFLNISIIAGSPSLDSLVWHWDDSEVAGDEARFQLWKYNASDGWTMLNDTPDTAGNTLALADLASFSDFAILEDTSVPPTSQGDEKSSQPKEDLSISVSTACDGFIVTVRDDPGALVEDAFVEVVDNTHQSELDAKYTDSSGKVYFSPCDIDAEIQVSKSGAKGYRSLHIGCGLCGECQSDDDCDDASYCLDNGCVPVQCPAGQVVKDHRCGYQCVEDADCAPGQTCSGNRCVYGCYSDDMCSASQYCDIPEGEAGGVCTEIECGCGVIGEHACAEFECCADSDCGLGEVCVSNKCALAGLTCPSTGIVGDEKTCNARQDGDICAGCDYQIRAPDGKTYMGKTDQDGNLIIPLDLRGVYTVTLFKDGQVLRTTQVESLPRPIIGEPERPVSFIEAAQALFLVILVAVMLVVLTYIRRRGGEKLKRPKA
ncbi:MAG: dickkopf-related protein, partial [Candidatus Micrarchaeota archaeon]